MQEIYSRSECDALIKIIQERVVESDDEPAVIIPIAWQANTQQHPVAYSSSPNTAIPAVSNPPYCPVFDNTVGKEWLKKRSAVAEGPCTNSHDRIQRSVKRSYSPGDFFEDARRMPKRNKSNSLRNHGVPSKEATANSTNAAMGPHVRTLFKDVPLLGTNNLTFSDLAVKGVFDDEPSAVAASAQHSTSTSSRNQREMPCVKAELLDGPVLLETDMTNLVQKNTLRVRNVSNKTVFQGDIEAAPSSSMGLQTEKSSRNCSRGFNLQNSIPKKTRSPARRARPSNNGKTVRSWNGPPEQRNPAAGQGSDKGRVQAKRPGGRGRPRKEWK